MTASNPLGAADNRFQKDTTVADSPDIDAPSRFLIGFDLGTTNSALAYVDTSEKKWIVRDFAIAQLVAPATVESRQTLPSFHYEASDGERAEGSLRLPWSTDDPAYAVGAYARDHGAAAPGRLVVSAKSWLSHSGVDRTAGLLPWHGAADVQRLSPVQVSARYLAHLRGAWDHHFPDHPMAEQDIVLTVPASFDEVARELTVQAAKTAGLIHVVLVEEPQAAFYAWIDSRGDKWEKSVRPGWKILVCDIGGGTTDFTLIQVRSAGEGKVLFHRVAVGEHLILGGDNLDLAIAHHVERKLGRKLAAHQWGPLVRNSRVAKETLLGKNPPERMVINIGAGGSKLVGGSAQIELSREEIHDLLLEGFLPRAGLEEKPSSRRSGFQEFGLPYARDAAITRYLAAFLTAHRNAGARPGDAAPVDHDPARPDLILFNGGLFESPVLRERLLDVMASWFSGDKNAGDSTAEKWRPHVLENDRLDLAVARGAAYYGIVRRGHGVRISGGLAHSYYIGVEAEEAGGAAPTQTRSAAPAICLVPAGVEEGQTVDLLNRTFELLIRQPVEFPLYASSVRTTDAPGERVAVDPEQMTALAPIRTVLQSGKKATADSVQVRLHAKLTEIGTLDIWCAEVKGDRTWRLQFDVRSATRADFSAHQGAGEAEGVLDDRIVADARSRIAATFRPGAVGRPESLVKKLEESSGIGRNDWPPTFLRSMWETLMEVESSRRLSDTSETRWLNLAGYCLRPGYGLAADDWRVSQTWKLFTAGVIHPKNESIRAEWWILWRRLAGGMTAGQQRTLADPLIADWRMYLRKAGSNVRGRKGIFEFGPHESAEVWRVLGSLELLAPARKLEIGAMLLERLAREEIASVRDAQLFAIGRIGARVPMYGPLNALVDSGVAEAWAHRLISAGKSVEKNAFAIMQLCRRTGDRYRDVSDEARESALNWMIEHGVADRYRQLVREGGELEAEEQRIVFGESLPRGLRIQ
ncbi:MAG TPA: Hsp70 family protein [Tepidisphaeraceae bacterium]|jgi:hypothetical protein|nr:Hsp70 family protein [Tepidisphaeraceae bacterium]